MTIGVGASFGPIRCSDLVENVADVAGDGGISEAQLLSDLLVGFSRGDQP
jgi:hypothetical protein